MVSRCLYAENHPLSDGSVKSGWIYILKIFTYLVHVFLYFQVESMIDSYLSIIVGIASPCLTRFRNLLHLRTDLNCKPVRETGIKQTLLIIIFTLQSCVCLPIFSDSLLTVIAIRRPPEPSPDLNVRVRKT